ncbi:uncharacterized protein G2W53_005190 [Senna tora]|uniref:Uncharacterized protein n=1 Tax=Senna tora TaxID=362788 RepID=A0A834XDC8_9FABA|nr:uncharacterized protein G2W53_005190 [Senna tora]
MKEAVGELWSVGWKKDPMISEEKIARKREQEIIANKFSLLVGERN